MLFVGQGKKVALHEWSYRTSNTTPILSEEKPFVITFHNTMLLEICCEVIEKYGESFGYSVLVRV